MSDETLREEDEAMRLLSSQVANLRMMARLVRDYEYGAIRDMLREAADTIESLRDRLQAVGDQACHATQANYEHCKYSTDRGWCDTSRYSELFGTPERAARTLARMCAIGDGSCAGCPMYEANLEHCKSDYTHLKSIAEWLRGDAE